MENWRETCTLCWLLALFSDKCLLHRTNSCRVPKIAAGLTGQNQLDGSKSTFDVRSLEYWRGWWSWLYRVGINDKVPSTWCYNSLSCSPLEYWLLVQKPNFWISLWYGEMRQTMDVYQRSPCNSFRPNCRFVRIQCSKSNQKALWHQGKIIDLKWGKTSKVSNVGFLLAIRMGASCVHWHVNYASLAGYRNASDLCALQLVSLK